MLIPNELDFKKFREWYESNPLDKQCSPDLDPLTEESYTTYRMYSPQGMISSYKNASIVECISTYNSDHYKYVEVYDFQIKISLGPDISNDRYVRTDFFTGYGTDEEYFQYMCAHDIGGLTEEDLRNLIAISMKIRENLNERV